MPTYGCREYEPARWKGSTHASQPSAEIVRGGDTEFWQCVGKTKCGFCSGNHDTKYCKEIIESRNCVTPRCPNCYQEHNAWSIRCPLRPGLLRVYKGNDKGSTDTCSCPSTSRNRRLPTCDPGDSPAARLTDSTSAEAPPRHGDPRELSFTASGVKPNPQLSATTTHNLTSKSPSTPPSHHVCVPKTTDAVTKASSQLAKAVETLRQEVTALKQSQDKPQKDNRNHTDMCTSSNQTLKEDISSVRKMLAQIL